MHNQNDNTSTTNDTKERGRARERDLFRKRKRDHSNWKQVQWKRLRLAGQTYISQNGKINVAKSVQTINCRCPFKCNASFTESQRQAIFDAYYKLGTYERQRDFILQNIKERPCMRKNVNATNARDNTYEYYLHNGEQKIRVCKEFFCGTINIGEKNSPCCYFQTN